MNEPVSGVVDADGFLDLSNLENLQLNEDQEGERYDSVESQPDAVVKPFNFKDSAQSSHDVEFNASRHYLNRSIHEDGGGSEQDDNMVD